ncbi:succinylglutamate desuccinylase [Rhizobium laguerreae]|uniref:succinylglutamate desuccinylase/aspartoacylase domain-containing protein n=1 Tax=Rhizobium laguerreae TaxID=1076926 RepID=UPI00143F9192|nr:succinylglutamate desuccinylase/aspartoacylase family protein [Rhizobium laguerreae]MBY3165414.1 succinylglutamate desuccinylase [Rhizobium laguerreae]NKM16242.1 succinylglutamate desuccinylase [Rhizobium laguerreae]
MEITGIDNSCTYGEPGVFRGWLRFKNPTLAQYQWPLCEIRGTSPGPKLCISAGVHVNEVSAIEAAVRLQNLFDPQSICGVVSIIPLINQPALYRYSEYVCPIDGKNINHTFPGRPNGTFSEALCDAIVNEWTPGSDCYVDMHGGDLREQVSKFVLYQRRNDKEFDEQARRLAMCFDSEIVLGLPQSYLARPGRPPTAFARGNRVALMSEAGSNGLADEETISFHVNGVLNIARTMGILDSPAYSYRNARLICDDYVWVHSPVHGEFHAEIEPGRRVEKGQRLGSFRNFFGETLAEINTPSSGLVLWRITHPSIPRGEPVLAIAVEERAQPLDGSDVN